ncbi:MAG: dihydropteroate synthase, partial [Aeromonas salmonicida]
MQLISKGLSLSLERPHVMGILNVTPDSFSDGGHFNQIERAMVHARQMVSDGATLIDIGGESTRPGAPDVSEQEELDRVIPVVERLVAELDVMISLDTSKAAVMREGCKAGAHLINDVRALLEPGALAVA